MNGEIMNKLLSAFLLISFFAVITACGNKEESENQMPNMNDQNIMRTNVHNASNQFWNNEATEL